MKFLLLALLTVSPTFAQLQLQIVYNYIASRRLDLKISHRAITYDFIKVLSAMKKWGFISTHVPRRHGKKICITFVMALLYHYSLIVIFQVSQWWTLDGADISIIDKVVVCTVLSENQPCPRGSYLVFGECHLCPTGSYQPSSGYRTHCYRCPRVRLMFVGYGFAGHFTPHAILNTVRFLLGRYKVYTLGCILIVCRIPCRA